MRSLKITFAAAACAAAAAVSAAPAQAEAPDCSASQTSYTVASGQPQTMTANCTGANSYGITVNPSHGSLQIVDSDTVVYRSQAGYDGPDSFSFSASDGIDTTVVPVSITVTPGPPGLPPVCPETTVFVAPGATVHLKSPCFDPDGEPVFVTGFTTPIGGFVPIHPDEADYTAPTNGTTSDSFSFTVSDGTQSTTSVVKIVIGAASGPFETASAATPSEPLAAGLALPAGVTGTVVLQAREVQTAPPDGFTALGTAFDIRAPAGTADNPLTLTFKIDASQIPDGEAVVFRDGVAITQSCTGPGANPDPCLVPQPPAGPGEDLTIVVRSSHASLWQLFERDGYAFDGFYGAPHEPAQAGRAIPLKFSLGGDQGPDVLTAATTAPCEGGPSAAADDALKYDPTTQRYQYNWKTSKAWAGTCRKLSLELDDGSTHDVLVRFR